LRLSLDVQKQVFQPPDFLTRGSAPGLCW